MRIKLPVGHLIKVANANSFHEWLDFSKYSAEIETEKEVLLEVLLTERIKDDIKELSFWSKLKLFWKLLK